MLSIDFETRSTVELKRTGVYPYAAHSDTDLWLMAWAMDDEEPELWLPGQPLPHRIREYLEAGGGIRGWNAGMFERIMWREIGTVRYGFPELPDEQWFDTQAEALTLGLPARLEKAAQVLGLSTQKDMKGHRLMLKMSRPRRWDEESGQFIWWDSPENLRVLGEYCKQDVRTEREIGQVIRPLTKRERRLFLLDLKINDRGVKLDTALASAAKRVATQEIERQNQLITEATEGAVDKVTQVGRLKEWVEAQGLETESLNKAALRELLDPSAEMDPMVRQALQARSEASKSSLAKIDAMFSAAGYDQRMRGLLKYHAAHTGRWGGKLVQPQNFPRGLDVEHPEQYIPALLRYEKLPLNVIAAMLRSMLTADKGMTLGAVDFSAVEARVLAWMAGEERLLELYRRNESPYPEMGAYIFGVPKEEIIKPSDRYTIAKNTVLGAGYQMGKDRFQSQVWEQAGIRIEPELAEQAINAYRALNRKIKDYWFEIDTAAKAAVSSPGEVIVVHPTGGQRIKLTQREAYLYIVLPSHRSLAYFHPRIEKRMTKFGTEKWSVTYEGFNNYTHQWGRIGLYGGMLTENVVQAVARDLLADAMLRVDPIYPVILTVHDEIVVEAPAPLDLANLKALMEVTEPWAQGLPVDTDAWTGERYRK